MSENGCGEPQWFYDKYVDKDKHNEEKHRLEKRMTDLERDMLQMIVDKQNRQLLESEEEHFRSENPALMDAWEQYQMILKLTKEDNNG